MHARAAKLQFNVGTISVYNMRQFARHVDGNSCKKKLRSHLMCLVEFSVKIK